MLTVTANQIRIDTRTLTAVIDAGLITSLTRKSDGRELIRAAVGSLSPLQLVYGQDEVVPLGTSRGDQVSCRWLNDRLAEIRVESWDGDGVMLFGEDVETGDLLVEPSASASRPGLRACRWILSGMDKELELIAPFWQGVQLPLDDPLIRDTHWRWPDRWEAGLAILHGRAGGLWIHCRDDRYRYKNLRVGSADDPHRLGLETESYGPLERSLAAGGLTWRINVYDGGWQEPAGQYRQWLSRTYGLREPARPEWIHDLRLAVSWCPTDPAVLDALARHLDPKTVLLHVPNWRSDGYDENYPTYRASEAGRAFVARGRELGFRVMPHCNAIDMDPSHPVYPHVQDFVYRHPVSRRVLGWSWYDGGAHPVPESNAARLRHRSEKVMVKVHPGLAMWRSILAENVQQAVRDLALEVVFLDVSHNTYNLANSLVENQTATEGMKRLLAHIRGIDGLHAIGGEGRNEIVATEEQIAQVHLFFSSGHRNVPGLERTGRCALNEFLFGQWCRSFGYSWLGGETEEERLRMRLHVDLGAIPTITIRSADQLERPNEGLKGMLSLARA